MAEKAENPAFLSEKCEDSTRLDLTTVRKRSKVKVSESRLKQV